jgi:hypothetical protein
MPIPVQCPKCGKRVSAPDALAGKRVKCPGCASAVAVAAPIVAQAGGSLLDDLDAGEPLAGGSLGNLDSLSKAVAKSAPANPGGPGAASQRRSADPLGPAPVAVKSAKKSMKPMLILGGSIGAGVLLLVVIISAVMMFSGGDSTTDTALASAPVAAAPQPTAPAPKAAAPAATATPAGGDEFSSLLDAPESAKPPATTPGQPPSDPAGNTNQQAPANNQSGQPGAAQQPSAPVVVAIAPPPPVNPVNPQPPINNPPPQSPPPGVNMPLTPQQKADRERVSRDQLKVLRQYYISLLSGDGAVLIEKMRWSPESKRPTIGVRWGVSLPIPRMAKNGRPQPPVAADSEQAIIQAAGPAGKAIMAGLNDRVTHGDFSVSDTTAGEACRQLTVLPGEDRGEVMSAARERDVDLVILLKLEYQPPHIRKKKGVKQQPTGPNNMVAIVSARIVDLTGGSGQWSSDSLSNKKKGSAEHDAAEWADDSFEQIDQFKLQPVPDLDEKQIDKRVSDLEKKKPTNPLPNLLEVRYYLVKGLISQERAEAYFTQVLGEQGKLLTSDDAKDRKHALDKVGKL